MLSSASVVTISRRRGTLVNVLLPSASNAANKIGNAAFLAPEIVTSPQAKCHLELQTDPLRGLNY
ncbi:hypothetical protein ACOBV9_15395 [Pseudoalteromonas espejiana]